MTTEELIVFLGLINLSAIWCMGSLLAVGALGWIMLGVAIVWFVTGLYYWLVIKG